MLVYRKRMINIFMNKHNSCNKISCASKVLCLFVFMCLLNHNGISQDLHFSQFYETPLLRNPALAGIFSGDMRFQVVYRSQWQSVTVPFQTTSIDGEFKFPIGVSNDFVTFGGEILYDQAGTIAIKGTDVQPSFNYHKSLSDDHNMYLSFGFLAGINERGFDQSKVTTDNQFDPSNSAFNGTLPTGEKFTRTSYAYFDASTGLSFNTQLGNNPDNNMFLGVAIFHLNQSKAISFYSNPALELMPRLVFSGGLRMTTDNDSYLTIQADYDQQGPHSEAIGGLIYTFKLERATDRSTEYSLDAGVLMRVNDAIIPVIKLTKDPLSIAFSYDANISALVPASNGVGGFELGIVYQTFYDNSPSKDAMRCPRF
jgi:type IX secretion system PorP/SprF family membrane protein